MNRSIIPGLCLLLACVTLPACSGIKAGGTSDSSSDVTMERHAQVKQSLDQLITAYENKNSRLFTSLLSDHYTSDSRTLETAIQRDFSSYHNLALRYEINNLTLDDKGNKAFVAMTFTRGWTDIKTSETKSETKETSLVFVQQNGVYKLESQRGPLLFGLN